MNILKTYLTPLLGDKQSIQLHQVEAGTVWGYEKYKDDCPEWEKVKRGEAIARSKRIGLWKQPNPLPPWKWREIN